MPLLIWQQGNHAQKVILQSISVDVPTIGPLCRYMGAVWTLVVTGMDGIVFWGPTLIHSFIDSDSGVGAFLHSSGSSVNSVWCSLQMSHPAIACVFIWPEVGSSLGSTQTVALPACMQISISNVCWGRRALCILPVQLEGCSRYTRVCSWRDMEMQHCRISQALRPFSP